MLVQSSSSDPTLDSALQDLEVAAHRHRLALKNQTRLGLGSRRDSRRGGAVRMQKEKVLLPSEDQYKVPSEFREEILDAMKKQTPKNYEQLVNEYYRELVQ